MGVVGRGTWARYPGTAKSCYVAASVVSYSEGTRMKTCTLDEAQSLLPVLESLLKRAFEGKRAAQEVESRLAELARRIYLAGGMRVDTNQAGKQRAELE